MIDKLKQHKPNILVIGDLMIDHYLWGECERISPEAPVQVVEVSKETTVLGGAGNVVNNLLTLGARVTVMSVVGSDNVGVEILNMLDDLGANFTHVIKQKGRKTSKKSRILASNQQIVRYDFESKESISKDSADVLYTNFEKNLESFDAVLLSDYGKGVLGESLTRRIIQCAKGAGKLIAVDPKGSDYSKYSGATLLTPNKKEASIAANMEIKDEKSLENAGKLLRDSLDLKYAVITLSEDGMAIFSDETIKIPTVAREVYDVTGAGDTVLASLGFALTSGLDIKDSAIFATNAAAVAVGKLGSATVSLDEIDIYEKSLFGARAGSKTKTKEEVVELLKSFKNKKIVFTNGCFDILHVGHVKYLEEARSFGDVLIVGLNSDESVKRLKGKNRPINTCDDRAYILSALESVSFVVEFTEDTPYELICAIKPDILVKGGDYKEKNIVGSDIAKEVRFVDFVDGKSTTNIIKKAQL